MGAARFRSYAKADWGVDLTSDEAEEIRAAYFKSFPGLRSWQFRQGKEQITRTIAGRRRAIGKDSSSAPESTVVTPPVTSAQPGAADPTPAAPPAPRPVVEDRKEPTILQRVEPDFPAKALNGRRGIVVLKILVNEQGRIARVLVERGIPGSVLESASINAVLRWRFQPAIKDGQPVRAWTKATFDFTVN